MRGIGAAARAPFTARARRELAFCAAEVPLGLVFLVEAHRLHRDARRGVSGTALRPMRMFHFSNSYLALLFVFAAIDPLVR